MGSKIEWTDEVWNPTVGCSRVSPGCDNCYAERVVRRQMQPAHVGLVDDDGVWTGEIRELDDRLMIPFRWERPRRVFVDSMSDLFAGDDDFMARVFAVMRLTPQHTYQVLTKRQRSLAVLSDENWRYKVGLAAMSTWDRLSIRQRRALAANGGDPGAVWPLPNVWLGVSVENQRYAELRIPKLLEAPAAVRFLSIEPLLGHVSLSRWLHGGFGRAGDHDELSWVIVGGESGPSARPMHPAWARSLAIECSTAGVPFFFKQWGEWSPERGGSHAPALVSWDGAIDSGEPSTPMYRVGKKIAGRELDGRTWDEYPG